ncbi:MAG: lipoyl(octanoyl) transferase LipB [Deltaproteobacteria bacterium]|nr:lipoyl(octanoyl) transferase LipB [Deltaproteobacteria bacterium]MCB9478474.1 lipoyl(octanoyl) transferase LipB [Deltaproteobacteria bacterium]
MTVRWTNLGIISYDDAFFVMSELKEKIRRGDPSDYILFLEHPNVITRGYTEHGTDAGLLSPMEAIQKSGFELIQTDRGGKTTLHNPGQLVGYLVFDLKRHKWRPRNFVELIEATIIDVLNTYEIPGKTIKNDPGVFVRDDKIAFIGLNIDRGITTHGFSLNVRNDLRPFAHIVPCGQLDRPITSIYEMLREHVSLYDVYWRFVACFERLADLDLIEVEPETVLPKREAREEGREAPRTNGAAAETTAGILEPVKSS